MRSRCLPKPGYVISSRCLHKPGYVIRSCCLHKPPTTNGRDCTSSVLSLYWHFGPFLQLQLKNFLSCKTFLSSASDSWMISFTCVLRNIDFVSGNTTFGKYASTHHVLQILTTYLQIYSAYGFITPVLRKAGMSLQKRRSET